MTYTTFPGTTSVNGIPQNATAGTTNQPGTGYTGQPFNGQTIQNGQHNGQYNGQYSGQIPTGQYSNPFGGQFNGQYNNQYGGQFFGGYVSTPTGVQYVPFFGTPWNFSIGQNGGSSFGQNFGNNFTQPFGQVYPFGQFGGSPFVQGWNHPTTSPFGYPVNTTSTFNGFPTQGWNSFNWQPGYGWTSTHPVNSFNGSTIPAWYQGRSFNGSFGTPSNSPTPFNWNTPFNSSSAFNYVWNTPFNYNWNTPANYGFQYPFQASNVFGGVNGWNSSTPFISGFSNGSFNNIPWSIQSFDNPWLSPFATGFYPGAYGITPNFINSISGTQVPVYGVPAFHFGGPVNTSGQTGAFVPTTGECCGIRQAA
jgi:hypothetical protein